MTGCPAHQNQQSYLSGYPPTTRVFKDVPRAPYSSYHFSSASEHVNSNYLFRDPKKYSPLEIEMITPKSARNRRKGAAGDAVKHRRTRSGCFTCRQRRVKCDEGRPVCERCRKGNRDCAYPDPATALKTGGKEPKSAGQDGDSSDDCSDDEENNRLETIIDGDELCFDDDGRRPSLPDSIKQRDYRGYNSSDTPSLTTDQGASPTPSVGSSVYHSLVDKSRKPSIDRESLPKDIKFFITHFVNNVTYHHYSMKSDFDYVLHREFLDEAFRHEALLNAVAGFAAYHYTLQNTQGKIQDFLQYYNKAVTFLLKALKQGEKPNIGSLLCMLQLAAIEEYLGDWVNLLGHQKAACSLLTTLYTPQTVMETPLDRMMLGWYCRFDLYGALLGGYSSSLPDIWFTCAHSYDIRQAAENPNDIRRKIEVKSAELRLIGMQMANLTADITKGRISMGDFNAKEAEIAVVLDGWLDKMDPALLDPRYAVTDFLDAPPRDPNDIVDPYMPGLLFTGELWPINILRQDHLGVVIMLKYLNFQLAGAQEGTPAHKDLQSLAHQTCQYFEAIELYPGSPKGAVIAGQACLGIAAILLPQNSRYHTWTRRKLALVECQGYIFAHSFRLKMSELFCDDSVMDWWLPNNENCPPMVKVIHDFVEERSSAPKDNIAEDLKDMKQVFKALSLSDDSSSSKSGSMEPQFEEQSPRTPNW